MYLFTLFKAIYGYWFFITSTVVPFIIIWNNITKRNKAINLLEYPSKCTGGMPQLLSVRAVTLYVGL